MAKGEIAHDEQFLLWPQCFQLYLTMKLSFMEIFEVFVTMFSKLSAADLLYIVGKGLAQTNQTSLPPMPGHRTPNCKTNQ